MDEQYIPQWVLGNGRINETAFCRSYLELFPMYYSEGAFFNRDGRITDLDGLRREIYVLLADYVSSHVSKRVDSILNTMKLVCYRRELPGEETRIAVHNGTYDLAEGFRPEHGICRCRLKLNYNPDAPKPERWLAFLEELLEPQDIDTLQEYMGYCLIPTTRAQKMLCIIGKGGEGKSRIGVVMKRLLGDSMSVGPLGKLENSRFGVADLEHQLLFLDDDLQMEALSQTNHIKTIVTADLPMDIERKGVQTYQGRIHARLMAFGNASLQALHDRSHGFFRRQIILTTRDRPEDRVDDPFLGDKLLQEIPGIFLWCLEGLKRLQANDYRFTISARSYCNLLESVCEGTNIVDFLQSSGYIRFDSQGCIPVRTLYNEYTDWCTENLTKPLGTRTFSSWLKEHAGEYNIRYSKYIPQAGGKEVRGFYGIRSCLHPVMGRKTAESAWNHLEYKSGA